MIKKKSQLSWGTYTSSLVKEVSRSSLSQVTLLIQNRKLPTYLYYLCCQTGFRVDKPSTASAHVRKGDLILHIASSDRPTDLLSHRPTNLDSTNLSLTP